jgi:hypothetical protein
MLIRRGTCVAVRSFAQRAHHAAENSMADYVITLKLEVDDDSDVQARIWIDSDLPGDLWSEAELRLDPLGPGAWSGQFSATHGRFMYRVGMLAQPGTIWSLSIQNLGGQGRELLFDSDEVTLPKECLVGMCEDFAGPRRLFDLREFPRLSS